MDFMIIFSFCLVSAMLSMTTIGLIIAAIMPGIEKFSKNFFMGLFSALTLYMLAAIIDLVSFKNPSMFLVGKIIIFFEYFFVSLPPPMFTAYLLKTCGENLRRNLLFRAVIVSWAIYFILLIIAQFTEIIYYVTPETEFFRGDFHIILCVPLIAMLFFNFAGIIRRRKILPKKYFVAFLIFLIPLLVTFSIHVFVFVEMTTFFGIVISTLAMFGIILYDQIEQYLRQQKEISQQQANILVLQMRPHFIYNAMMSVYYLCDKDSKKAQQVTLDFTTYLRKNFIALVSEETISFSDELEHTRAYLAIEQVQFEDDLLVEYDTPHKDFCLPPLTLQPIVENSVKHGMDPDNVPLRIKIQTRKTDFGIEIIVEDDGVDFFPDAENFKPNSALANIQQRLKIMCDGFLTISSRVGGGTVVTVTIPIEF